MRRHRLLLVACAFLAALSAVQASSSSDDAKCLQNCVGQASVDNQAAAQSCAQSVDTQTLKCICNSPALIDAMGSCIRDRCDSKVQQYFEQQCAGAGNVPENNAVGNPRGLLTWVHAAGIGGLILLA